MLLPYLKAFLAGGLICALGQLLLDKTNLTPAKILSAYVVTGVILGGTGLYRPFSEWAGAGATVPLLGFGNTLAQGIRKGVAERGLLGILSGGLTAAAAGICAAVFFAYLMALFFRSREKT